MPNILNVIDADHALQTAEASLGISSEKLIPYLDNLGSSYHAQGEYAAAEDCYRRALEIKRSSGVVDADNITLKHKLGILHRIQSRYTEAEQCYLEALALAKKLYGDRSKEAARQNNYLAGLYYACALYDLADRSLIESIDLYQALHDTKPETIGLCHLALALIMRRSGQEDDSLNHFQHAKRLLVNVPWELHVDVEIGLVALAVRYFEEKDTDKAEVLLRHYLIVEEQLWPYHPLITQSYFDLADHFFKTGDFKAAEACYLKVLKKQQEILEPSSPPITETLKRLATLSLKIKDNDKAIAYMKLALGIDA